MKVKSIKSIYLSQKELKGAICNWLYAHGHIGLSKHLESNPCDFDWSHEDDVVYFAIDMDGQFEESEE